MSRTRGGRKRASPPSSGAISLPERLVLRRAAAPRGRAAAPRRRRARRVPARASALQQRREGRRRQARLEAAAQPLHADAGEVRVLGVERRRGWRGAPAPAASSGRARQRERRRRGLDPDQAEALGDARRRLRREARGRGRRRRGRDGRAARVEQRGERAPRGRRCAWASSWARRSGVRRWRAGARRSRKRAAADGALGAGVAEHEAVAGAARRSGARARAGRSPRRRAGSASPSSTMRAPTSAAAWCRCTGIHCADRPGLGWRARGAARRCGRSGRAARGRAPCRRGAIASLAMPSPARFSAQRSPGAAALGLAVLRVDGADARREARRADHELVAGGDAAGEHRAGHDGAGALQREGAVDGQAEAARRRAWRPCCARRREQAVAQRVDALAGDGGDRQDLGARERRCRAARWRSRRATAAQPLGVDEVGLGQRDDAAGRRRAGRGSRGARASAASRRRRRRRRAARSRCRWRRRACCGRSARGRARRRSRATVPSGAGM